MVRALTGAGCRARDAAERWIVLGAARDNMIGPREIEATARAYNTQAVIIPDVAHNSMLEQGWQTVAERILVWLDELEAVNTSVPVTELVDAGVD